MLYDILTEDLWELDQEAFNTLQYFTGTWSVEDITDRLQIEKGEILNLIEELGAELILNEQVEGKFINSGLPKSPIPSLRTILMHVTLSCNLTCLHCYLDKATQVYINPDLFKSAIAQLEKLQGLKVLISGGEPLLHPQLFEMLESIKEIKLRKMLLSNGTLIDEKTANQLKPLVHEVQISLDGTDSHNKFRNNPHAFVKSVNAIKVLNAAEIDVSVATMIHAQNIRELPELNRILKELDVKSWALDVPSQTGEFINHPDLYPAVEEAGAALRTYGWGAPFEETHNIYACGAHLCALMPNGDIGKCGFFVDQPVGNLNQTSLKECWTLIQENFIWSQKELECASLNCPHLSDCRGGCRYRASKDTGRLFGIDRVKCAAFEFKNGKKK